MTGFYEQPTSIWRVSLAPFNSSCDNIAFTRYAGKIKQKKHPRPPFVNRDTFSQAFGFRLQRPRGSRNEAPSRFGFTASKQQRLWSSSPGILAALQVQHSRQAPFICPAPTSTAGPASLSPSSLRNSATRFCGLFCFSGDYTVFFLLIR